MYFFIKPMILNIIYLIYKFINDSKIFWYKLCICCYQTIFVAEVLMFFLGLNNSISWSWSFLLCKIYFNVGYLVPNTHTSLLNRNVDVKSIILKSNYWSINSYSFIKFFLFWLGLLLLVLKLKASKSMLLSKFEN